MGRPPSEKATWLRCREASVTTRSAVPWKAYTGAGWVSTALNRIGTVPAMGTAAAKHQDNEAPRSGLECPPWEKPVTIGRPTVGRVAMR